MAQAIVFIAAFFLGLLLGDCTAGTRLSKENDILQEHQTKSEKRGRGSRPHLWICLIDDLGYAGLGYNSPKGEPKTPRIDRLAADGMKLRRHYTHMFCSPTRSSLLSGRLPIHVNQHNNALDTPGGGIAVNMSTLADLLRSVGYSTHHAGKWHCGFSSQDRIPTSRGFDTSVAMLGGSADHFTNCARNCPGGCVDLWENTGPARGLNGTYSQNIYTGEALRVIESYNGSAPTFVYLAFQNTHEPMEYLPRFLQLYDPSIYPARRIGLAMVSAVDEAIGNVTDALKTKDMWNSTLMLISSDNGGPHDHESNYPLRGSKGTRWEGGVRGVAFLTGGWLSSTLRGTTYSGMIHVCDWYATFSALAGKADPTDHLAEVSGLPPIDSIDMTDVITGDNLTSPRVSVVLAAVQGGQSSAGSGPAIVTTRYKLLIGKQIGGYQFPGYTTPNATGQCYPCVWDCGDGCLFDLDTDEIEHVNIYDQFPDVVKELKLHIEEAAASVWESPGAGANYTDPAALQTAEQRYHGFWGPWMSNGPLPPPPPPAQTSFDHCDDITVMCIS